MSLKQGIIKVYVSTDGSDEEYPSPGPTLSFPIGPFHLSWPDIHQLAMTTRLIGLSMALSWTAASKVVA